MSAYRKRNTNAPTDLALFLTIFALKPPRNRHLRHFSSPKLLPFFATYGFRTCHRQGGFDPGIPGFRIKTGHEKAFFSTFHAV